MLVIVGGVWFLDVVSLLEMRAAVILPAALAVVGAALIVGARNGPHPGLVVVGLFLALAVVVAGVAPRGALDGAIGTRSYTVTSVGDIAPRYDLGMGGLDLDISAIRPERAVTVEAEVGAGRLVVALPPGIPVRIEATVGVGEMRILGEVVDGVALDESYQSDDFTEAGASISVLVDVGVGELEVTG